ncbi:MAG: putative peptidoglycan glycosyltransferase FtsW [Actinomycetaceae bacterium]|nr:putative peptidoglycan glycosyltransferase FtsW [Actinomycetaceae bacterium]
MISTLRQRIPKIRLGVPEGEQKAPSPVTTYYLILVPIICLMVMGFVMVFSASTILAISEGQNPYAAYIRNLIIMAIGVVTLAIIMRLSERIIRLTTPLVFLGTLGAQALVLTPLGIEVGGNTNWLAVPLIGQVQPAEALKVGLALWMGWILVRPTIDRTNATHMLVNVGLPVLFSLGLVMAGEDMGTALIFLALVAGALIVAGIPWRWWLYLAIAATTAVSFFVVQKPSRLTRILGVIPGFREPPSTHLPEQGDHALWALGSGGLTGVGPGASREKWNYLAAAHTDFIYAVLGEEMGLIGTLFVLICFGVLLYGIYRLTTWHQSDFARITSAAIGAWIGSQAIVNMGFVVGLTPIIGVPLPLISTGGSAFLFTCVGLGIILGFARHDAGMERAFGTRNLLRVNSVRRRRKVLKS